VKYFLIVLITLFLFSCKGTPETVEEEAEPIQVEAETPEVSAEVSGDEAADDTGLLAVDEEPEIAETPEVVETPVEEPVVEEVLPAAAIAEPPPAQVPPASVQPPVQQPVQEQAQEPAQESAQTQTSRRPVPPGRTSPPSVSAVPPAAQQPAIQPPGASSPSTQSSTSQPPAQPSSSSTAQTPSAQSVPAQPAPVRESPPLPPPALLGPAEERTPPPARETTPQSSGDRVAIYPPAPARDLQTMAVPYGNDIVFSRTVRATVGQTIEIPFTGTGWSYLGELASRRGIVYSSRRYDPEGQTYIFRAEEPGTFALKFFKENFVGGYILNDHVQVIVSEAPAPSTGWYNAPIDRGRVIAEPRWPNPFQEAEIRRGSLSTRPSADAPPITARDIVPIPGAPTLPVTPSAVQPPAAQAPVTQSSPAQPPAAASAAPAPQAQSSASTSAQPPAVQTPSAPPLTAATLPGLPPAAPQTDTTQPPASDAPQSDSAAAAGSENLSPDILLQRAKEAFDGGDAAAAIALLDQLKGYYPSGTDELYWYYGQFYEANTPSRNILLSIDYYKRLVNEYPQSTRFNDARRRIAYLERYYINIQ
jgi:hypothetical protein